MEPSTMAESSQPTQPATQPFEDPRRRGKTLSNMSEDDVSDVICVLHPNSPAAFLAVQATMLAAPEHILQNEDLDDTPNGDNLFNLTLQQTREIALRMSSTVRVPKDGFRFGRNPMLCDVLLTNHHFDKSISNTHFKIFVNGQGSLMLQDLSTNGTIHDGEHLKSKDRRGLPMAKPAMRALKNGDIISVLGGPERVEIKFMVRIPSRGDYEELYESKLRQYLSVRGKVANFASMRENMYGNHWNGGSQYNFTGLLGKGAFATVYRVQTKDEGTVYAAKELDKRRFTKNNVLDLKFDSELKIMRDLKHPNIVDYIDCQTHRNWVYIIMEYVPCGELSKEMEDRKSLLESEVQQIAKQIMRALDYLHKRNITHRDIKPDNILIASREPLIVKLSDFGLSKCVNDQETFLKTFCGTLLYCAPEVYPDYNNYAAGLTYKRRRVGEPAPRTSPYDQSVDMWSFGAVLFHLLCGKPPIMGRGDDRGAQMLSNIMTKDVDFGPLHSHGVSAIAIDFVGQLLNRNPMMRPKEKECLNHAWLRGVPDLVKYSEDGDDIVKMHRQMLDAVEEFDEDDFVDDDLMNDLNQLTQAPPSSDPASSLSQQRPTKRLRTFADSMALPNEIAYPLLPQYSGIPQSQPTASPGGGLFGEITASAVADSSILDRQIPAATGADVPEIRNRIEQVSVNDYASFNGLSDHGLNASSEPMQYPKALAVPQNQAGPAPSLLGAEAQIGMLNMASPDVSHSDAGTPDTHNPVTPHTRELSPSSSLDKTEALSDIHASSEEDIKFSRHIDVDLLKDDEAFAASVQAREDSRAQKRRETFHVQPNANYQRKPVDLIKALDFQNHRQIQSQREVAHMRPFSRTIDVQQFKSVNDFNQPLTRFGQLTPVPGSFGDQVIHLDGRLTSWGRGVDCTVQHPNVKDTRIPKYAVKVTFWAPGMESHVAGGGDWTQVLGIRTLISTSATSCIWVNDIELRRETKDGSAALFGKIYTGDIIMIHRGSNPEEFLSFRADILFGDGARPRPRSEEGFHVQRETYHHRIAKTRNSMRQSSSVEKEIEDERQTSEPAVARARSADD